MTMPDPTPAVVPDARARLVADLDRHASAIYRDYAQSDLWSALIAARDALTATPPASDAAVPAGEVDCGHCNGEGDINDGDHSCFTCGGSGRRPAPMEAARPASDKGIREAAIAIAQIEARELGYCDDDVAALAEPDGDDLLVIQAVERALAAPKVASDAAMREALKYARNLIGPDEIIDEALSIHPSPSGASDGGEVEPVLQRLGRLTDTERADIARIMSGEASDDLIRRGDVLEAIRDLRTDPVPSQEYQRGIGDVARAVVKMPAALAKDTRP
jgi:hypothetical protein